MNAAQLRKYPTSRRTSQDGENPLSHRIERLRDFRFPEVQIVCAVAEIGIPRKCEGCYRLLGQLPSGLICSAILGHELTCSISGKRPSRPRTVSLPRGPSGSSPAGSSPSPPLTPRSSSRNPCGSPGRRGTCRNRSRGPRSAFRPAGFR